MNKIFENKDLTLLEEMAQRYNLSPVELGKAIVKQYKKSNERQFRVSEQEFETIFQSAEKLGFTVKRFCEYACNSFMNKEVLDENFFGSKSYGDGRIKRITVEFKDGEVENKMLEISEKYNIEIGTLIRYCALNFN